MSEPQEASGRPSARRPCLLAGAAAVVLALLLAALWSAAAPTPPVRLAGGVAVSDVLPEFYVAQDAIFALLAVAAGVLHGILVLMVGRSHLSVAAVAVAAGLAGSVVAWRLGVVLGPPSLEAQRAAGGPLVAPLGLQARGVLGLWPATTAAVVFAGLLAAGLRAR